MLERHLIEEKVDSIFKYSTDIEENIFQLVNWIEKYGNKCYKLGEESGFSDGWETCIETYDPKA